MGQLLMRQYKYVYLMFLLNFGKVECHFMLQWYTLQHCTKALGFEWATTFTTIAAMKMWRVTTSPFALPPAIMQISNTIRDNIIE